MIEKSHYLGFLECGSLPLLRSTARGSRWRCLARLRGVDPARQQLHRDIVDLNILLASRALIFASCQNGLAEVARCLLAEASAFPRRLRRRG
jgi:hypothetical protein